MTKFRSVAFGGYNKEDVDEYIDSLLKQLDEAKSKTREDEQEAHISQMKEKITDYEKKYQAYAELIIEEKMQVQEWQAQSEQKLKRQKEIQEEEIARAYRKLEDFVANINRQRESLEYSYSQLGKLIQALPLLTDDVLRQGEDSADTIDLEDESESV